MSKKFQFGIPVDIEKSSNGDWIIRGQASTEKVDKQGEKIIQSGLDISPIKEGRGLINIDHDNDPKKIIGALDGTKCHFNDRGLYVEGYLFKESEEAKAIKNLMSSVKPENAPAFGFSVEGKILERAGKDDKVIKRAVIDRIAWTTRPVNTDAICELAKSLSVDTTESIVKNILKKRLIKKAMSMGFGYEGAPTTLTGGSALAQESLDGKKKKDGEIPGVYNVGMPEIKDLWRSIKDEEFEKKK